MTEPEAQEIHELVGSAIMRLDDVRRTVRMFELRGVVDEVVAILADLRRAREIAAVAVSDAIGNEE